MQIHIPSHAGTFALCTACKAEPRHIETRGRSRTETMQMDIPAVRHSIECSCGSSTGLHGDLDDAVAEWGQRYGQTLLALPAPAPTARPPRSRRPAMARKEVAHG